MSHYITIDQGRELKKHYENFPVATLLFPKKIRNAATILYQFARQCDDIADEGDKSREERLQLLNQYSNEIANLKNEAPKRTPLFLDIEKVMEEYPIKVSLLKKLMRAFKQDVNKKCYLTIDELNNYCDDAANPAGEMILSLFGQNSEKNLRYSNSLCRALALIGIIQDIEEDYAKGRIYLPQDEMKKYKIKADDIQNRDFNHHWIHYKNFWINRVEQLLNEGRPLERELHGRIRLQISILIKAIELLIKRMRSAECNLFNQPPKLSKMDWAHLTIKSILPL